MDSYVIFHKLVQRDLDELMEYYEKKSGVELADQCYSIFIQAVEKALKHPKRNHFFQAPIRRCNLSKFPYHFLYKETEYGIRVLVLRHDGRSSSYGLRRK